jgi:hypothetical protein
MVPAFRTDEGGVDEVVAADVGATATSGGT